MKSRSLSQFFVQQPPVSIVGSVPELSSGITDNSREVTPGGIFVAYRGPRVDGHTYILDAIDAGAAIIILDDATYLPACESVCAVVVSDSKQYLADLAWWWYSNPTDGMTVVGITGTNGKTSCASCIYEIWRATGISAGLLSTVEHRINDAVLVSNNTTPGIIELARLFHEMKSAGVTHVVMEVSSHALVQKRTIKIPFAVAALTNLTQDHLDYHGTMDDYAAAKALLFTQLAPTSHAVLNGDDPYADVMTAHTQATVHTIGTHSRAGSLLSNIRLSATGSEFQLADHTYHTPLLGRFNVYNVALVIRILQVLGMDEDSIGAQVGMLRAPRGRAQLVHTAHPTVLVDYAHTPDGIQKILEMAREITSDQSIVIVFGCGGDRDTSKRPLMASIATTLADYTVITSDNPRTEDPDAIIADIVAGVDSSRMDTVTTIPDRSDAIQFAITAYPDSCIIIAGKGHEDYQIIGTTKHHFDDAEVVRSLLSQT